MCIYVPVSLVTGRVINSSVIRLCLNHIVFFLSKPKRIKKITMLPVKRGRGRPPKFNSAPNSPKPMSPVPNGIGGYGENGKHKKFKYKRVITADSPVDEVMNDFYFILSALPC